MVSNSIYEVKYLYEALWLNEKVTEFVTGKGPVMIAIFMLFTWWLMVRFSTLHIGGFRPGAKMSFKTGPQGVIAVLIIFATCWTVLSSRATVDVFDYSKNSWKSNKELSKGNNKRDLFTSHKVPKLLKYTIGFMEGAKVYLVNEIDSWFSENQSQAKSPMAFYRSMLAATTMSIEDPVLREQYASYNDKCILKVISMGKSADPTLRKSISNLSSKPLYRDEQLTQIFDSIYLRNGKTCLTERARLKAAIRKHLNISPTFINLRNTLRPLVRTDQTAESILVSQSISKIMTNDDSVKLLEERAKLHGGANWMQKLSSIFSTRVFGVVGAGAAIKAAETYNFFLKAAPHVRGWILLFLIGGFPFMFLFIMWKQDFRVLGPWLYGLFAVSMWTPIDVLLAHISQNVLMRNGLYEDISTFSDGISLHAVQSLNNGIYLGQAVYFVLQLGVMMLTLMGAIHCFKNAFQSQDANDAVPGEVKSTVFTGGKLAAGKVV